MRKTQSPGARSRRAVIALGTRLTVIAHVCAENEAIELLDEMRARFEACEQVQQCYYVPIAPPCCFL
jgi:hypothetical protein